MKKILIATILFSFLMGDSYSDGFHFFIKAKRELRQGNADNAKMLFLQAKENFEIAQKNNSSQAILKLAEMYCNGWGVEENQVKAKILLSQALKLGLVNYTNKCLKNLK
jgi:TPR repeat protein